MLCSSTRAHKLVVSDPCHVLFSEDHMEVGGVHDVVCARRIEPGILEIVIHTFQHFLCLFNVVTQEIVGVVRFHMFSNHHFYRTAGQVENPKVVEIKKDGQSYLEFELVGTSPLLVAWKEISKPAVVQNNSQTNFVAQTSQSTATQHSQPASSNIGKVQPKIKTIDPALKSTKNTETNFSSSYKKDQGDDQKNGGKEDREVVKREKEK